MNRATGWIGGTVLGAGLMFLLDPRTGRRRRALLRDRLRHATRIGARRLRSLERLAGHELRGAVARAAQAAHPVPDDVLTERIRSQIGHAVSHPRALHVEVRDGRVTLSGEVRCSEVRPLLDRVSHVAGVIGVENELEACTEESRAPGAIEARSFQPLA